MQMNESVVKSHAKINLALRITGRYPDGYHSLSSLFLEIELHDRLRFTPSDTYSLIVDGRDLTGDHSNTIYRAYDIIKKNFGMKQEWEIEVEKIIPPGAGLGGGSSNGAAVLRFLNEALGLGLRHDQLEKIALEIGCDVPFFIQGGLQFVEGRGEKLTTVNIDFPYSILLVYPGIHISTGWAYSQFSLTNRKEGYKLESLFSNGDIHWELFENQFEDIVFQTHPEVGKIKEDLVKVGAIYAGLSGSGSTVFGIYDSIPSARMAERVFTNYQTFVTLPTTRKTIKV